MYWESDVLDWLWFCENDGPPIMLISALLHTNADK